MNPTMTRLRLTGLRGLAVCALCCLTTLPATATEPTAPLPAFREEFGKQDQIYKSQGAERPEGYVIDRSLLTYAFAFPEAFKKSLAMLQPTDRWLDIGAGEARAVTDYALAEYEAIYKGFGPLQPKKAQVVAMSIEDRRTHEWHEAAASIGPGRRICSAGRSAPTRRPSSASTGSSRI